MPAITNPAISGGSRFVDRRMNTFSASEDVVSAVGNSVRPTSPINTAIVREIITHTTAMRRERVSSSSRRIAIKRRSTCGIPKYPSPHARADATGRNPYTPASPKSGTPSAACCTPSTVWGVAIPKKSRNPGISFTLSITAPRPPADAVPTQTITPRAMIITTACMKSEALSARKPPMIV